MTADKSPLAVLIVEDDPEDLLLIRDLLVRTEIDLSVDCQPTYGAALDALQSRHPDVCLLDYNLGDRTGLDLLDEPVVRDAHVPTIVLTGIASRELDVEMMRRGAYGYLVKGRFDVDQLERAIRHAVERGRIEHQLRERVKEQQCLHAVASILHEAEDEKRALQRVVEAIPPGWQFPDLAEAQLTLGDHRFATPGFRKTRWMQTAPVRSPSGEIGRIAVAYRRRPLVMPAPFLPEEQELLDAIADRVASATRGWRAERELRRSEGRHRAIIENSSDIVTIIDADGRILYLSPAIERFGYAPDDLIGTPALALVHPEDRPRVEAGLARALHGEFQEAFVCYRFCHRDGSLRHVESSAENLLDVPEVGGLVVHSRDVSEKVDLEEKLAQAQKMEALGRLAGGVAHDFNNALTVIKGHGELLRTALRDVFAESGLNDSHRMVESAEEIHQAAERAASLTRQLLAFSRKQVVRPRIVDVNEVVTGTEKMIRRLIPEDIRLETRLAKDLPMVEVDPGQLEQVVMNLVVNALQAMRDQPGKLTVSTSSIAMSGGTAPEDRAASSSRRGIRLEVSDTGEGIASDQVEHLFEPFFTTKEEGTGLGLAIVYGAVERMGGRIDLESEPGKGATFRIDIPAAATGEVVEEEPDETNGRPEGAGRILVVEDEASLRILLQRILESAGYEVDVAGNGDEGLDAIRGSRAPYRLVVSDVVMPGLSGAELVQRLRELDDPPPVLLMSGYPHDLKRGLDMELDDVPFLEKPFSPTRMLQKVAEILDG